MYDMYSGVFLTCYVLREIGGSYTWYAWYTYLWYLVIFLVPVILYLALVRITYCSFMSLDVLQILHAPDTAWLHLRSVQLVVEIVGVDGCGLYFFRKLCNMFLLGKQKK
ncbi:unnamed protein product [Laminaria digitata]